MSQQNQSKPFDIKKDNRSKIEKLKADLINHAIRREVKNASTNGRVRQVSEFFHQLNGPNYNHEVREQI